MSQRNHLWNVSVAMTPELVAALQALADRAPSSLREVYETAAREFLRRRKAGDIQFRPAPKNTQQKTVWLCRQLYESVRCAAAHDQMTISDFLHTAFTDYCIAQGAL